MNFFATLFAGLPDLSGAALALCLSAFVLGGLVKGTLGVGLPLVVVPLLSLVMPSPLAICLMAVPVLGSNTWQVIESKAPLAQSRRFMPLLLCLLVSTVITVPMTLALPAKALNVMLSVAVFTAVVLMAWNPTLNISARHEKLASAGVGLLSGMMGGVSSMIGPIIITYLMALRLSRENFVGTISIIYLTGTLPLYLAMAAVGRFGWAELLLSLLAMGPAFVGMAIGKKLRGHLSEIWFRRVLLGFLSVIVLILLFK